MMFGNHIALKQSPAHFAQLGGNARDAKNRLTAADVMAIEKSDILFNNAAPRLLRDPV
jgi:hypothetical protein